MPVDVLTALCYLAGITGITLLVTRVVRTRRGPGGPVHDRYEAAFLNGGPARVVDTALAALHADGRLAIGGPGIVAVVRPTAYDPVERAVLQAHATAPHGALHHLRMAVMRHPAVQEIGDGLAARGLVVDPATRRTTLRWCAVLGLTALALFPVSIVLTAVDIAASPRPSFPFVFKVVPVILAAGLTALVCGSLAARQVTPAGRSAVFAYGRAHAHLADAALLVALHGLRALPDPVLREQILAAARIYGPPRRRGGGGRRPAPYRYDSTDAGDDFGAAAVWCAGTSACGGGGGGGGSSCSGGGSGSSCSSGSCSGGGSGCGGGGGGSSCSSSSSSSCSSSSSSGSSCSSSSS
ncbi:TIGR04222 domain-containing membrane protein [Streptomyces sp. NBC_00572]|uniref:TIGR04222 domain-containing membrane protein n=1 Tax=Streptomyces sp. NBC_00572 TaxID=2903664 RepID=UPI00224EB8EA|nr:TIGR04222 domain-containing membrane protein [Streptomyces sp. NBC_00572]MCX4984159.1 TIGR04222 domain-containing membrane protein [Streptomyces sp. NBC_00572]